MQPPQLNVLNRVHEEKLGFYPVRVVFKQSRIIIARWEAASSSWDANAVAYTAYPGSDAFALVSFEGVGRPIVCRLLSETRRKAVCVTYDSFVAISLSQAPTRRDPVSRRCALRL